MDYPKSTESSSSAGLEHETTIKKVLITPMYAKELLSNNKNNRRLRDDVVNKYATDMRAGRWKEDTFEVIKIFTNRQVGDGQHRLQAVIKSGCSIYFHVAYNVKNDVFDVLDTGRNRNATDVFFIDGVKNANVIPSVIQLYSALNRNETDTHGRLTNTQLLSVYNQNPELWQRISRDAVNYYNDFAKIMTPSLIGGLFAYLGDINRNQAIDFFNQLCRGSNITNNVILLLRNKLIEDKTSNKKMTQQYKIALIYKAWNAFRLNTEFKILRWSKDANEAFPKPI